MFSEDGVKSVEESNRTLVLKACYRALGQQLTDPVHSSTASLALDHSLCVRCSLPLFLFVSLSSREEQVVIRSETSPTPPLKANSPSFSVCAKWEPCSLPPVCPLHCSPSRLLLKVLSFHHFFKKRLFFLQASTRSQITSELLSDSVTI